MKRAGRLTRTTRLTAATLTTIALTLLGTTIGCTGTKNAPTPENFTQALNAYFVSRPACLLPNIRFPFTTTDKVVTKQMDSLVKSLLLEKSEEMSIHASRYTVSTAGERFAPRFCYGHREIVSIDSFTPLAVVNGFKETTVNYHYEMKEVPVWAKSPDVLAAFPDMAHAIQNQATGTSQLAQTISSWQIPD
ncbi:MAG: hypothetical protein ABI072_00405 [Edaphobacter sp.]